MIFIHSLLLRVYISKKIRAAIWSCSGRGFASGPRLLFVFPTLLHGYSCESSFTESALIEASLFLETDTGYRLLKKCELDTAIQRNDQKNLKTHILLVWSFCGYFFFCLINSTYLYSTYIQISPKLQRVLTKLQSRQFMHHYYLTLKA